MRLSLFLFGISACQSFVLRRSVAVSHPFQHQHSTKSTLSSGIFSASASMWKKKQSSTSTNTVTTSSSTPSSSSSSSSALAETLTTASFSAAENTTNVDDTATGSTSTSTKTTFFPPPKSFKKTEVLADDHDFIKPDRDLREYRYIRLSNNLQALLISTANTDNTKITSSALAFEEIENDDHDSLSSTTIDTTATTTLTSDVIADISDDDNHDDMMIEQVNVTSMDEIDETDVVVLDDEHDSNTHTHNTNTISSTNSATAKIEAASVHVQAGHFDDTIPGLAHFHEHMLFLGTEKYPSEDEYEGFLSKYGGTCNAYTDMEDTNYYFSITTQQQQQKPSNSQSTTTAATRGDDAQTTSEGLSGALDRLAQFFIAPKFEESMVDREIRAIDSEYKNGKTSDSWRNYQFLKAISNPKHPFSNFGCGNYESLTSQGSPPIEQLKQFWKTYYTTSNMRLAVVGSASLDALQKTVEETFGQIPYSNHPPRRQIKTHVDNSKSNPIFPKENAIYDPNCPAFGKEQVGKIRQVIPLLETRTIKVQFVAPPLDDPVLKKSKPHRVISHLLGHESPGSLHHLLNERGYITGLSSGSALDVSDFSLFTLSLALTPKGMNAKDEVLDYIFQWIALIKQTAINDPELLSKYHDELRQIGATNFKFRESGDPTDFCSSVSELMFEDIPPHELLVSGTLSDDYDPITAKAFLDRLTPENCMIHIIDSGLKRNNNGEDGSNNNNDDKKTESSPKWQVEPLYGAVYREHDIPSSKLKAWENATHIDDELHVPALNAYIPTNFSLRCDDEKTKNVSMVELEKEGSKYTPPTLLYEGRNFRMWHKMDRVWRIPKTFIRLSIVSPKTYESPRAMTLSRIYQRVLNDDLNSFVYDASLAGCSYQISCAPTGYKVSVLGYSEKLPILLDTLTSRMLSLIDEMKEGKELHPALHDRFEKAKDTLLRETKNYRLDTPYEVASYNARLLMEENVWYLDNYVDEMEGEDAEQNPLSMEDCAGVAEACLSGRMKADALCVGNIDENGAKEVTDVINRHFIDRSRPLNDAESPSFKSMKLPTKMEAQVIFGPDIAKETIPIKYQELAYSPSEENNAVELTLQAGCDSSLDYEGIGIIDLIGHIAYSSAYNQLRTREQLGYIVSVYTRKTAGGTWGLTVVVQSSSKSPKYLEERIEAWFEKFRQELDEMTPEALAMEARAVVVQLLEEDTKLSQEVGTWWNEIVATETNHERMTTPAFDRLEKLADELSPQMDGLPPTTMNGNKRKSPEELKQRILDFFDHHYAADAPERRVMSSRVFNHTSKAEYEESLNEPGVLSTYSDMRYLKEFLSTWPVAPYWRIVDK